MTDMTAPGAIAGAAGERMPIGFWRSPATKFFVTGLLTLALVIPLWMVLALTGEREQRRDEVVAEVGREWGGPQSLYGPLLVIPFTVKARERSGEPAVRHLAVLPETFSVTASAGTEERSVSIYGVPAFSSAINAKGRFGPVDPAIFGADVANIDWDHAYLSIGIDDLSGVEDAALAVNGSKPAIEPGATSEASFVTSNGSVIATGPGVHALLGLGTLTAGFDYALDLRLRGTDSLKFAPVGRQSVVTMKSNWAHPNFAVGMLPSERTISADGFDATWRVPYLARTAPQTWLIEQAGSFRYAGPMLGVGFVEPVDFYALVVRALKYGVMFVGATFLTVFMLEVLSDRRIHLVQYCLVGLILVMFFVLLLALSERIGFGPAYLIASTATGLVISAFVGVALASRLKAGLAAGSFAVSFALLYAILRLEDLALLAGAVVGFIALSLVLFATRRVDWSGIGSRIAPLPAAPAAQ